LIKIEDENQEASPDASPRDHIYDENQKGLFGFFRKTLSSVKKTFEKTFN
jgi:hypothetical protein